MSHFLTSKKTKIFAALAFLIVGATNSIARIALDDSEATRPVTRSTQISNLPDLNEPEGKGIAPVARLAPEKTESKEITLSGAIFYDAFKVATKKTGRFLWRNATFENAVLAYSFYHFYLKDTHSDKEISAFVAGGAAVVITKKALPIIQSGFKKGAIGAAKGIIKLAKEKE